MRSDVLEQPVVGIVVLARAAGISRKTLLRDMKAAGVRVRRRGRVMVVHTAEVRIRAPYWWEGLRRRLAVQVDPADPP